ncbi:MAG: crossover junction endodeoxyribonuclease RuvC [Oscillospiraceae bacterium]|jgi:crossover junction endodeoxyribonuclease RuvC|nr:crossover junction endodeoxyribonuclease RuvC [Oscillospiraceae bacterium]
MRILGFDPGIATVGYGAVDYIGNKFSLCRYGTVKTAAGLPLSLRLMEIADDAGKLIELLRPDAIAVEELFFSANVKTGIHVAHGRGVLLLECRRAGIPIFEYTPLQVKQAVVGYGKAEKKQVMEMVKIFLNLEKIPRPDDAADALAIAICHAHSSGAQGVTADNSV